jgi:cytochrome d ubiquinol oxidase subunit II
MVTLGLAWRDAPLVWSGLMASPRALPVQLLTGLSASTALWALWRRRYLMARVTAIVQVSCILWGWALAQYPWILPPELAIHEAAAPTVTLHLTLGALGLGALVLLPSLAYLFRIFKSVET